MARARDGSPGWGRAARCPRGWPALRRRRGSVGEAGPRDGRRAGERDSLARPDFGRGGGGVSAGGAGPWTRTGAGPDTGGASGRDGRAGSRAIWGCVGRCVGLDVGREGAGPPADGPGRAAGLRETPARLCSDGGAPAGGRAGRVGGSFDARAGRGRRGIGRRARGGRRWGHFDARAGRGAGASGAEAGPWTPLGEAGSCDGVAGVRDTEARSAAGASARGDCSGGVAGVSGRGPRSLTLRGPTHPGAGPGSGRSGAGPGAGGGVPWRGASPGGGSGRPWSRPGGRPLTLGDGGAERGPLTGGDGGGGAVRGAGGAGVRATAAGAPAAPDAGGAPPGHPPRPGRKRGAAP